jgi:20S proteasome subunit beta 1
MNNLSFNPYGLREGELSSGTTIMAVTYDGGVVLGADSRTSTGSYVANRVSDKIVPLSDYIWTCRSGSAADTQAVADYVRHYLGSHTTELGRLPRVKTAANIMSKITYNNKDRMQAGLICGGWDPYNGGQVFEIPLGGTLVSTKFSVGGSGSGYIYGFVDAHWREGMTKEECLAFVKKAIAHAMARDGSSGGVIRTVCIDQSGVEKSVCLNDDVPFPMC